MSNDYSLSLILGTPIPIEECGLVLHQPTIEEIAFLGEKFFFSCVSMLVLDKNALSQDKNLLSQISNFQIFMKLIEDKESNIKKNDIKAFLQVLFPDYKIFFTPRAIMFNDSQNESHTVDSTNFIFLQQIIRLIFNLNKNKEVVYNPKDAKAQAIADKIKKGRQKVAELKASHGGSSIGRFISILSVGLHIPIEELKKYTLFMIYDAMERYGLWVAWDIDLRAKMAGATGGKTPDDWMKNLYE